MVLVDRDAYVNHIENILTDQIMRKMKMIIKQG